MRHNVSFCLCAALLVLGAVSAKSKYDCDFENDFCGWIPSYTSYMYQWKRVPGGDPTRGTGPSKDASGLASGRFANIQVVRDGQAYKTPLQSPPMRSYATSTTCQMKFSHSIYSGQYPLYCKNAGGAMCKRFEDPQYKTRVCKPQTKYSAYMEANCAMVCGIKCGSVKVIISQDEVLTLQPGTNPDWTTQTVAIDEKYTGGTMEIVIEATTGEDRNSYIAIDNLSFTGCNFEAPSTVPPSTTTSRPTTTTTTTTMATPTIDRRLIKPEMYDCDFSNNMCGWKSYSKEWKWEISSKGNHAQGKGPESDADGARTGQYSIMKVTKSRVIDKALFVSPVINQFKYSPKCRLLFKYSTYSPTFNYCENQDGDRNCQKYEQLKDAMCESQQQLANQRCSKMCGIKCNNLKVYVTNNIRSLGNALFHERSPLDEKWYPRTFPIGNYTHRDFQVVFEAMSGFDYPSYIAIDNIKFIGCETKIDPLTTTTLAPSTTTTDVTTSTTAATISSSSSTLSSLQTTTVTNGTVAPSTTAPVVVFTMAEEILLPREAEKVVGNNEEKSTSVLGIALGAAGAAVVAIAVIGGVTYYIRKKKKTDQRSSSVSPLKEAWK